MDFDIADATQYLVIAGSHSYGMATPESDIDIRGWAIPPKEYWLSYHKRFEQHDPTWKLEDCPFYGSIQQYSDAQKFDLPDEPVDAVIYNLRKFVKLAADCNPNIIELLFVNPTEVLVETPAARILRESRDLFLSAKCKFTFSGYAHSQLKRINTHRRWLLHPPKEEPTRSAFGLPEHSVIPADQREAIGKMIDKQVRLWLLEEAEVEANLVSNIRDGLVELLAHILQDKDLVVDAINEESLFTASEIAAAGYLGVSPDYIAILQQEKKYRAQHREWKQYQDWKKNRNPKRAELEKKYGFDAKHGAHLARLLAQCEEILTKGTLTVNDPERAEWLLEIRNGSMVYADLILWSENMMGFLDQIYKDGSYKVPKKVNVEKIDALHMGIVEDHIWR